MNTEGRNEDSIEERDEGVEGDLALTREQTNQRFTAILAELDLLLHYGDLTTFGSQSVARAAVCIDAATKEGEADHAG